MATRNNKPAGWNQKKATRVELKQPTVDAAWKKAGFGDGMEKRIGDMMKRAGAGVSDLATMVKTAAGCPNFQIPAVDQVSLRFGGPLSMEDASAIFDAEFDIFNTPKTSAGLVSYETTFTGQPGEPQMSMLLISYFHHISVGPERFASPVNAWTTPVAASVQPASLDDFGFYDTAVTGGQTPLGPTTSVPMVPGYVDWGHYLDDALWFYVRARNLKWNLSQHETMLDEPAIKRAWLRDNVQEGTGSSSQVAVAPYIRQLNDYYREFLGTTDIALKIEKIRYGLTNNFTGAGLAEASLARISRALEFADVTFGGAGFRRLRGDLKMCGEDNRLKKCMAWPRGVPYGFKLPVNDTFYNQQFINAISADSQAAPGIIPQTFTDDANVVPTVSVATSTGGQGTLGGSPEYSSDSPQVLLGSGGFSQRVGFKGAVPWEMILGLRGFPFPQNLIGQICANEELRCDVEENVDITIIPPT